MNEEIVDKVKLAFEQLQNIFNVEPVPAEIVDGLFTLESPNGCIADTKYFFSKIDEACQTLTTPPDNIDIDAVQLLFAYLAFEEIIDRSQDGALLLIKLEHLITEITYPNLWKLFVEIPGDKGYDLIRDNFNGKYHIHYCDVSKNKRTNVIFTFNPSEPKAPTQQVPVDTLYWKHHHRKGIKENPNTFRRPRKQTIHSQCIQLIPNGGKSAFEPPGKKAHQLWP